ncbi:MAG: hypothetical protein K5756_05620 [Clostridiales bacterium]|nr:hypothetical protein [Clostridiales bacterium]
MKKFVAFITIIAVLLTVLTACGKPVEPDVQETTLAEQPTEEVTVTEPTSVIKEKETTPDKPTEPDTTALAEKTTVAVETTTAASAPASVEEIVTLYNTAVNKVKPEAKQITRTYSRLNIPTETLELPSGIQKLGQAAIKQFVKGSDKPEVWTSRDDLKLGFPVGGTDYSSKMTPDMVKSATCTDNGDTYTVKIVLKNDALTNPKKGQGYAGVFNTVAASTFEDINIPTVTFEKVKINGINGSITCTIDKATQRVTDITFANTDILDIDVKIAWSNLHAKMNLVTENNYKVAY